MISALTHAFREQDTLAAVKAVKDVGFDHVELWRGHRDGTAEALRYDDARSAASELRRQIEDLGLKVSAYCPGGITDEPLEDIRKWAEFALGLGTSIMTGCLLRPERAEEIDRLLSSLGVVHAIENHKGIYFEGIEPYEKLFAGGRFPSLGINVDTGHLILADVDVADGIRRLAGRVYHVHLKDMPRPEQTEYRHSCPVGTGLLDVPAVLGALAAVGYSGPITLEYEDHNPQAALSASLHYMRDLERKE